MYIYVQFCQQIIETNKQTNNSNIGPPKVVLCYSLRLFPLFSRRAMLFIQHSKLLPLTTWFFHSCINTFPWIGLALDFCHMHLCWWEIRSGTQVSNCLPRWRDGGGAPQQTLIHYIVEYWITRLVWNDHETKINMDTLGCADIFLEKKNVYLCYVRCMKGD